MFSFASCYCERLISLYLLYIQFKFFVDGEWRHDERLPVVSGNYGIVNIIRLTRELDPFPITLAPEIPRSRSHMDVDHDALESVVKFHSVL